MQYRNDYMPITCGAYNNLPIPYNHPLSQAAPHNGQVMGSQHALPVLPTGVPAGGAASSAVPTSMAPSTMPTAMPTGVIQGMTNGTSTAAQVPVTVESTLYTPGFLRTQIGRKVRVEFLLGTNLLTDRTGTLVAVGASYIILRMIDADDLIMCDIYSIKFVTIIL